MNKYIERLVKEWREHGKIILAVDYDSTLFPYSTIDNKEDIDRTIRLVRLARETGAYITIFTASNPERYEEIHRYCDSIGIEFDAINKNPINLPYGNQGKIFYNINLCDRSGLRESLDTLEQAMFIIRSEQNTDSVMAQQF